MERMEKRKLGETFKARVSDDPNALVKPNILGYQSIGSEGTAEPPLKNLREARLCQNLSWDWFLVW